MAKKSITTPLVWVMMGLLILGLGGFGVTNLSGTVRSVGSVGDVDIDVNDYARSLQQQIRAIEAETGESISFARAQRIGLPDSVMVGLVSAAAMDDETARIGLSVSDETLRDEIVSMRQFSGIDGEFDREGYRMVLESAGLSEAQYEDDIRAESSRNFLQAAVMAGVTMPEGYMQTMLTFLGERRDVSWSVLERGDLITGLPVPQEADLSAYHTENEEQFTAPERKRITYAWLTPDMIVDTVEVDEQALRDAYAAREDDFNQPERRLVERLAFPDAAAAQAALSAIESGDSTFDDAVTARGLDLVDVDLGDVDRATLEGAADTVFGAQVGDVVGPLDTSIGPALFRVNAILSQQITTYEQALPDLRSELASDRARRVIDAQIDTVDDLLAGGATLEDLTQETDMQLGQIDWHADETDDIAAYPTFRTAAAGVSESDYPTVTNLDEGGIFAIRLDEVIAPELQPLDEVRDAVTAAWEAETVADALKKQAEPLVSKLASGASFDDAGLSIDGAQVLTRRGYQDDTPADFIDRIFEMSEGDAAVIEDGGRVFVVKLDKVQAPDPDDTDLVQLEELVRQQAVSSLSQDMFQILANDIRDRVGISIDQQALNAVHANFQ